MSDAKATSLDTQARIRTGMLCPLPLNTNSIGRRATTAARLPTLNDEGRNHGGSSKRGNPSRCFSPHPMQQDQHPKKAGPPSQRAGDRRGGEWQTPQAQSSSRRRSLVDSSLRVVTRSDTSGASFPPLDCRYCYCYCRFHNPRLTSMHFGWAVGRSSMPMHSSINNSPRRT